MGLIVAATTCAQRAGTGAGAPGSDGHAGHAVAPAAAPVAEQSTAAAEVAAQGASLPAGAADAKARLAASPRHGEWVMIGTGGPTGADSVRAWIVYPERRTKAPVVVVVHEVYGLTPWIRAVADQFASDGFIAIAPDLLTSKNIPGSPTDPNPDSARAVIRTLVADDVHRQLEAVGRYGMALPAALPRYGIVGFCWGGAVSFAHASRVPTLGAAVVYYGTSPPTDSLASVRAPVLGLYGENDTRVNATIAPADSAMRALGRTYERHIFPGAGHGFLRAQDGRDGHNLAATKEAWPRTLAWFRKHLEG
jgi:carboxymethylenebutenolidase